VVNQCPTNLTGADFYALCSDALMHAIREQVEKLEEEGIIKQIFTRRR
jgi:peroxin-6